MTIEETIQAYEDALNKSDTEGIIACFGKEPIFMPPNAPAQIGLEQVKRAYDYVFKTIKLDVALTIHEKEVLGDIAYVRTTSTGTTHILAEDLTLTEGNNELFIFALEEDSWKIHRFIFATNQPR